MTEHFLEQEDSKFLKFIKKNSEIIIFIISMIGCFFVYEVNYQVGIFEIILVLSWFIPSFIKKIF